MKNGLKNDSGNHDNSSVGNSTIASMQTSINRLENALVAGVTQATEDNNASASTSLERDTPSNIDTTAGTVGSQFMKRRKKD